MSLFFQELHDIEVKQQELERQGVKLEKTIRELCEKSDSERLEKGLDNNDRDSLGPEAEDLIMQLFELVNEKVSEKCLPINPPGISTGSDRRSSGTQNDR